LPSGLKNAFKAMARNLSLKTLDMAILSLRCFKDMSLRTPNSVKHLTDTADGFAVAALAV